MNYSRQTVFQFSNPGQYGIDEILVDRIIFVESMNILYKKVTNVGLDGNKTIDYAISNGMLMPITGDTNNGGGSAGGNLRSDGTVLMDYGYNPVSDKGLVTKEYVDSASGGLMFDKGMFGGI